MCQLVALFAVLSGPGLALEAQSPTPLIALETINELPSTTTRIAGRADPRGWPAEGDRLRHSEVFPGVDVAFARDATRLEIIYIVAPGSDLGSIRLRFPDHTVSRLADGGIELGGAEGFDQLFPPEAWQRGRRQPLAPLAASFRDAAEDRLRLSVPEREIDSELFIRVVLSTAAAVTAPSITATAVDSLSTDVDGDTEADPGDVVQYDVTIDNTAGTSDATDVELDFTEDPLTTAAVFNITPIAFDSGENTAEDTAKAINLVGQDFDAGETATLTYTVVTTPPVAEGALSGTAPNLTFTPAADFNGTTSFTFKVTDTKGDDSNEVGTITFTVTAVNDDPTITNPGAQATFENVATGAIGFTVGDTEDAAGTLAVTATSSNTTLVPNNAANLALGGAGANRTITITPANNETGTANITLEVTDSGTAATQAVFQLTVNATPNVAPTANADSFETVGNTELRVDVAATAGVPSLNVDTTGGTTATADGVLDNDTDADSGPSALVVSGITTPACADVTAPFTDCPTTGGGKVTMQADGSFMFTPAPGDTGTDTFEYSAFDGAGSSTATVTITLKNEIWWVKNDAPAGGGGTSTDPFDTLAEAETAAGAGDTIFVFAGDGTTTGQNGGITLDNANQRLVGEAIDVTVPDTVNGVVGPTVFDSATNTRPNITNAGGDGVTLANVDGVEVRGLNIDGTGDGIQIDNSGGPNTITIDDVTIGGLTPVTGNGINSNITGGTLSVTINQATAIRAGGTGILLDGTPAMGFNILGFAGNSVDGATVGDGIDITLATFDATAGGAFDVVSFGDTDIGSAGDPVGGDGIELNGVTGDISFTDLDITTATGRGIEINNAGGAAFSAAAGTGFRTTFVADTTINATGGAAVDIDTAEVAGQIDQISSAGGTNGVNLEDVTGTLTITDTGAGSTITGATDSSFSVDGGTVAVTYQGDITQGNNAAAVSISGGHQTGTFTFETGTISATNGTGLQFNNADGTYNFNGTTTLNGGDAGIDILAGSAGTFTFSDGTVINDPTGDAFNVTGDGTASPAVTYTGTIDNDAGDAIEINNTAAGSTITFNSGAADAIEDQGSGIFLDDVDQTVNITADAELTGSEGIDINTGSGTFTFTDTDINSTGTGVDVTGGTSSVNFQANSSVTVAAGNNVTAVMILNHGTGTIDFDGGVAASNGNGLFFQTANGGYRFDGTNSLNGGDAGIDIVGLSAGNFTFSASTTITNPSGPAFRGTSSNFSGTFSGTIVQAVPGQSAVDIDNHDGGTFTFDTGSITDSSTSPGIDIDSSNGGSISFNGFLDLDTQASGAVDLDANSGGTINFAGGLDIDTTSGTGFDASGGGTITITGTNTVDTSTGTGVNIENTTIGGSNVTFRSISVNGATNGIVLDTTGSSGSFTVTGDASLARNGTGGTIQNTTGDGIVLDTANDVTLQSMNLTNAGDSVDTSSNGQTLGTNDHAIQVEDSTNLQLRGLAITNPAASGLEARNLTGTSNRIDSDTLIEDIDDSNMQAVDIRNANNAAMTMVVDSSTFRDQANTNSSSFILFEGQDNGTMDVTFTNNTVEDLFGVGLEFISGDSAGDTGTITTTITGNTFRDAIANGRGTLRHSASEASNLDCTIGGAGGLGNTFQDVGRLLSNTGIIDVGLSGGSASGDVACDIVNNLIDQVAVTDMGTRGVYVVSEGTASTAFNIDIQDNDIRDVTGTGIHIEAGDSTGLFDARIDNNDVGTGPDGSVTGSNEPVSFLIFENGVTVMTEDTALMNVEITNNDIVGTSSPTQAFSSGLLISAGNSSTLNATVTDNTSLEEDTFVLKEDFQILTSSTMCVDLRNNTAAGTAEFLVDEAAGTLLFEGAGVGAVTAADITGVLANGGASTPAPSGTPTFNGGSNCTQPMITAIPLSGQRRWLTNGDSAGAERPTRSNSGGTDER